MSKQDRQWVRTAAGLEQKYNFGKTFAEVYGLARDAQKAAEEANKAVEGLDHEEIFNRLTNYGKEQGIYRGIDGHVYINASYLKSGTIATELIKADELKVLAANIQGTLTADKIDASALKVQAANITGLLKANQIDATELCVEAANITGEINAAQLNLTDIFTAPMIVGGNYWSDDENTKLDLLSADETEVGIGAGMILYRNGGGMPIFAASSTVLTTNLYGFNNHEFLRVDSSAARPVGTWNFAGADVYMNYIGSNIDLELASGSGSDVIIDAYPVYARFDSANERITFWFADSEVGFILDATGLHEA
jgi:hypothetical protein